MEETQGGNGRGGVWKCQADLEMVWNKRLRAGIAGHTS